VTKGWLSSGELRRRELARGPNDFGLFGVRAQRVTRAHTLDLARLSLVCVVSTVLVVAITNELMGLYLWDALLGAFLGLLVALSFTWLAPPRRSVRFAEADSDLVTGDNDD
jgi:hypothetical protein